MKLEDFWHWPIPDLVEYLETVLDVGDDPDRLAAVKVFFELQDALGWE